MKRGEKEENDVYGRDREKKREKEEEIKLTCGTESARRRKGLEGGGGRI